MAKKKAKQDKKVEQAQVFVLLDKHDVQDMQDAIEGSATCECHGGAHVYSFPTDAGYGVQPAFVVSAYTLTPKQIHTLQAAYVAEVNADHDPGYVGRFISVL